MAAPVYKIVHRGKIYSQSIRMLLSWRLNGADIMTKIYDDDIMLKASRIDIMLGDFFSQMLIFEL